MSVYAVLVRGDEPPEGLESNIEQHYKECNYKYADNIWFINTTDLTAEVANKLNIKKGGIGRTLIAAMTSSYFGMSQPVVWEWLKRAFEKGDG